jgi:hypothetical protein
VVRTTEEKKVKEKWEECIFPLSWSVHHNFACEGRYIVKGEGFHPMDEGSKR